MESLLLSVRLDLLVIDRVDIHNIIDRNCKHHAQSGINATGHFIVKPSEWNRPGWIIMWESLWTNSEKKTYSQSSSRIILIILWYILSFSWTISPSMLYRDTHIPKEYIKYHVLPTHKSSNTALNCLTPYTRHNSAVTNFRNLVIFNQIYILFLAVFA